jgi:hypothetical protein
MADKAKFDISPGTIKLILVAIVVIILIIGSKKLFNKLFGMSATEEAKTGILNDLDINKAKMSKTDMDCKTIADSLYLKMKGWGTKDEDWIVETFESCTPDDLKAIYKAFGLRKYNIAKQNLNLTDFLGLELNEEYLDRCRVCFADADINF